MGGPTPRQLALGFAIGLLLRAILLPGPGSSDVDAWKVWAFAGAWDVTGMYGVGGDPPERGLLRWGEATTTTDYPPLSVYGMGLVGRIYRAIDPTFTDSALLTALVKMPGLLAEVTFVALLLTWGASVIGRPAAAWTALAFWLNPAIVINGAGLGYFDAQAAVPATAALLAAVAGHLVPAGALIAAAILTKVQAIFVFPVVLLAVIWKRRTGLTAALGQFAAGGLIVTSLAVLPFALRGALPNMIQAVSRLTAQDTVSGYALNVWWIITWLIRSAYAAAELGWSAAVTAPVRILQISRVIEVGLPNPRLVGTFLAAVAFSWLLWRGRSNRSLEGLAFLGGWCVFAYFLLAVHVHENHLYLTVPLVAIAAGLDRRLRPLFWALSAFAAFNMYIFYGLGDGSPPLINRRWTGIDITVWASAFGVWLFVRGTGLFSTDRAV